MEQQDGRQAIPFSIEAEKSVLGSMMLSREAVDLAAETLGEDDFYLAQHRRIFSAMAAIQKKNGVVDVVTLMEELDRLGQTENVGGDRIHNRVVAVYPRVRKRAILYKNC